MESKLIFSLRYLPNQVFWKAILTTAKNEEFEEFDGLCKELRKIYYCYWIAGYTTSKIKQLSFNIIDWLKKKKELDEIKTEIDKKMTDDNVAKWMKESLYNDVYGKSWVKPLLILIEYKQTDNSKITFVELERNLHADHILPEKWASIEDWKIKWTEDQAKRWIHRIGNLTLLSGKKNIRASNDSFEKKKKIYKGKGLDGTTAFLITQKIIDEPDWSENNVKERQQWIIEQTEKSLDVRFNGGIEHAYNTA